jgi:hypothetical protein
VSLKQATEICATTERLTEAEFKTAWNARRGDAEDKAKQRLALMKGQVAWHRVAMRLVFPKVIDLFFTHNNKARELDYVKKSITQMLKAASKMDIPDAPPTQLAKLVSLPVVGRLTPDSKDLEEEFARGVAIDTIDVEAIADAAKSRRAARRRVQNRPVCRAR